jgi:hypothetical protein
MRNVTDSLYEEVGVNLESEAGLFPFWIEVPQVIEPDLSISEKRLTLLLGKFNGQLKTRSLILNLVMKHDDIYFEQIARYAEYNADRNSYFICFLADAKYGEYTLRKYLKEEGLGTLIGAEPRSLVPVYIDDYLKKIYDDMSLPPALWEDYEKTLTKDELAYLREQEIAKKGTPCCRYTFVPDNGEIKIIMQEGLAKERKSFAIPEGTVQFRPFSNTEDFSVIKEMGKIIDRVLYLPNRDDDKAKDMYKQFVDEKIMALQTEIEEYEALKKKVAKCKIGAR